MSPALEPLCASSPALLGCTVAVVMGGRSSEREISLVSGREVARALEASAAAGRGPRRALSVEISPSGSWLAGARELDPPAALVELAEVDVFFLALHGGAGEDGTVQGLLESCGRRYTGSGVRASALCMDKAATRALARSQGIPTAPGIAFSARRWSQERGAVLEQIAGLGGDRWVVKPRCGGSSVATSVARGAGELAVAVDQVLARGDDALVEAFVEGVEVSCGVLGNRGDALRALPPVEIRPSEGRFFDYQQKYGAQGARELCPPEGIDGAEARRAQELAVRIHEACGCDGYSRADFIVPQGAEPVLLEVNTLPGLTPRSLLPQEAAREGIGYTELCLWIVAAALRRAAPAP
ncbi:MAG TPA: D-alanine--D-alanine ligase [Planctomycetota bacterium]|nr:D-alanine--D-alanine ligase [Planctomycetota bacterium]